MRRLYASLLAFACCAPSLASADDGEVLGVPTQIHGFVSQGFLATTDNNYLAETERGSFEFTEVGVNLTVTPIDKLRIGAQLFARDLGPIGNYDARFDWFYLDYHLADWLGLRAGRTKLPFGLYNELQDADAARVPVLLPQSVYPTENRDFLLALTGGELYGRTTLGPGGWLAYRFYGGTAFIDPTTLQGTTTTKVDVDVPYLVGGRLMWETPAEGLQVGGSIQSLRLDADFALTADALAQLQQAGALPADFGGTVELGLPILLWVASAEYVEDRLSVAAEYSRWHVDVESNVETLVPAATTSSERLYGMVSYRMSDWFTPGAYYSLMFPDTKDRSGRAASQHDVALTMRYDINSFWLAKLEGHYMHGTAVLDPSLNDGVRRESLGKDWGLLAVKTTAYF